MSRNAIISVCVALVAMISGLGAARAIAQCVEEQKLAASDAAAGDSFGTSVSVSGDTAVVGAQHARRRSLSV